MMARSETARGLDDDRDVWIRYLQGRLRQIPRRRDDHRADPDGWQIRLRPTRPVFVLDVGGAKAKRVEVRHPRDSGGRGVAIGGGGEVRRPGARIDEVVFLNRDQTEISEQGDEAIAGGRIDLVQIDDKGGGGLHYVKMSFTLSKKEPSVSCSTSTCAGNVLLNSSRIRFCSFVSFFGTAARAMTWRSP